MIKNHWYKIPDDQPNKDFYKGLVCTCDPYSNKHIVDIGYYEAQKLIREGKPHLFKTECEKLASNNYLLVCRGCGSVFYFNFTHPKQREPNYGRGMPTGQYCWHCLETNSELVGHKSWRYIKVPKTSPPEYLLNPYIKPVSLADRALAAMADINITVPDIGEDWWD